MMVSGKAEAAFLCLARVCHSCDRVLFIVMDEDKYRLIFLFFFYALQEIYTPKASSKL